MIAETDNETLNSVLDPLRKHFRNPGIEDVIAVRPCELLFALPNGEWRTVRDDKLTADYWDKVARVLANINEEPFTNGRQKISCRLPGGHRFEYLAGSAVETGLSVAIRVYRPIKRDFADWGISPDHAELLKEAVRTGSNIMICGGTATGKTSLLNLMLRYVHKSERLVTAEDAFEIQCENRNWTRVRVSKNAKRGDDSIGYGDVLDHATRARPDRVLLGEVTTDNAFPILNFLNTGHKGFMVTLHANSVKEALTTKFYLIIGLSGREIPENVVTRFLRENIDLAIQVSRHGGKRLLTEICCPSQGMTYLHGGEGL